MKVLKTLSESYELRGLKGKLLLVDPDTVPLTPLELYIRSDINRDWVVRLQVLVEEGAELDPVVVAFVKDIGKEVLVGGNHRVEAYKGLTNEIKVLHIGEISLEDFFKLQRELNPDILPMDTEELKSYAEKLYDHLKSKYEKKELYKKIAEAVGRSPETVRKWLARKEQEEKQQKIKKALELREKGYSLREIAKELNVGVATVKDWLERSEMAKIAKTEHLPLLTPQGTPTPEGLRLWSEYVEQAEVQSLEKAFDETSFYEFLKSKGYEAEYYGQFINDLRQEIFSYVQKLVDTGMSEASVRTAISREKTGIFKNLSSTAKAKLAGLLSDYIESLIEERERRKEEEELILNTAKEIIQNPEFVFSHWTNLGKEILRKLEEEGKYLKHRYHEGDIAKILQKHSNTLIDIYNQIPEITQEELKQLVESQDPEEFESLPQFIETLKARIVQEGKRPAGLESIATTFWNNYWSQKLKEQEEKTPSPQPPSQDLAGNQPAPSNEEEEYRKKLEESWEKAHSQEEEEQPKKRGPKGPHQFKTQKPQTPEEILRDAEHQIKAYTILIISKFGRKKALQVIDEILSDLETLSFNQLRQKWSVPYATAVQFLGAEEYHYWREEV